MLWWCVWAQWCWKMATTAHRWATELWFHHPPPAKSKRMCHSKADSEAQLDMALMRFSQWYAVPWICVCSLIHQKQQSNSKLTIFFLYSSLIHKTENIIFLSFKLITWMVHSFLGDSSQLGSGNGARLESGLSYSARKDQLELFWTEENVPALPWGRRVFQKDLF